ncbi:MAG: SET domain-containing protein-lysine N-methyltransferase [Pseudomonadota bacterium]
MATATSTAKAGGRQKKNEWIIVRRSPVHGYGCFARKFIPKGTRIIEYVGERLSHKEADKRYEDSDPNDNHTFLFIVDRKTVIDATYGGNESRFINHSCDGNCTSEIEKGRVWIDAIKDIKKGEELNYDYQIPRDKDDPPNVDEIFACRCGSPKCRGSMLWPPLKKKKKAKAARKAKSAAKRGSGTKSKAGKAKTRVKSKKKTTRSKSKSKAKAPRRRSAGR